MKKYTTLAGLLIICFSSFAQNVGIGTNTPSSSAQLDISSTTKGLLLPRMTTTQRSNIPTPAKGLLVYDTDLNALYHYNGSAWAAVGSDGAGFSLPYSGSVANAGVAFDITNTGGGKAITGNSNGASLAAIEGASTGAGGYGVFGSSNSATGFGIYGTNTSTGSAVYGFSSGGGTALRGVSTTGYGLLSSGNLRLTGGNTNPTAGAVLTSVDASGNAVWKPRKVAFLVTNSVNQYITANTERKIEFTNEQYDFGDAFTPFPYGGTVTSSTSVFTAPVRGVYHFSSKINALINDENYNHISISLIKNGTVAVKSYAEVSNKLGFNESYLYLDRDIFLEVGDKIWIAVNQTNDSNSSTSVLDLHEYMNWFSGHLVFAD